jgi:hypothetical protein
MLLKWLGLNTNKCVLFARTIKFLFIPDMPYNFGTGKCISSRDDNMGRVHLDDKQQSLGQPVSPYDYAAVVQSRLTKRALAIPPPTAPAIPPIPPVEAHRFFELISGCCSCKYGFSRPSLFAEAMK